MTWLQSFLYQARKVWRAARSSYLVFMARIFGEYQVSSHDDGHSYHLYRYKGREYHCPHY